LLQIFQAGNVVLSPVFITILNSITSNSVLMVAEQIRDLEKVNPDMTQADREKFYKDILVKERLKKDDEIEPGAALEGAVEDAIDEQKVATGEWEQDGFPQQIKQRTFKGKLTMERLTLLRDFWTKVK
jgi:hypothetical protein